MAVVSSTLVAEDNDLACTFSLDRKREYTLVYSIKTNSVMGPISVGVGALLASPDPLLDIWQPYACLGDTDDDAYCNKITIKRKSQYLYKATANFATLDAGRSPAEAAVDPFSRGVRYGGAKLIKTRAVTKDKDGKPLTTSAKEEYDEALEEDVVYAVLTARRFVASLAVWVADMATYINSVNSGVYRTLSARKWWCMDIEISDLILENGYAYYEEKWMLAMNLDTWDEEMLDRGWKILEGDAPNQTQVNATDGAGKALTAPVLLDGTGKKLGVNAQPVANVHRVKREVNWSGIPV